VPNLSFLRKRQKTYRDFSEVSAGAAKAFLTRRSRPENFGATRLKMCQNLNYLVLIVQELDT